MLSLLAVVESDTATWAFVTGPFIGLLVGFLSSQRWSSSVKAILNLLLSAIAGVITQFTTNTATESIQDYLLAVAITWITSISIYKGFWKPTGVAEAAQNSGVK